MTLYIFKIIKFLKSFYILASTFLPFGRANIVEWGGLAASLQPNRSSSLWLMGYCLASVNARAGWRASTRK